MCLSTCTDTTLASTLIIVRFGNGQFVLSQKLSLGLIYSLLYTSISCKHYHHALLYSTLQSIHKDTLSQTHDLKEELSLLKRSATPRPDWDRCAGYLETWEELSTGKSSDRKVDVLLANIAGVEVSEITKEDTFQGQVSMCTALGLHVFIRGDRWP